MPALLISCLVFREERKEGNQRVAGMPSEDKAAPTDELLNQSHKAVKGAPSGTVSKQIACACDSWNVTAIKPSCRS